MSWFTERGRSGAETAAMPWLPASLVHGGTVVEEAASPRPLAFDEYELARVAAAANLRGRQAAEAALKADPATRLAQAIERLANVLSECRQYQLQDGTALMRRTVALAAAIARAMHSNAAHTSESVARCAELLAGVAAPARLVLPAPEAEELRPMLPELEARAGLAGGLELEADPLLPPGAVRLLWPGGWLEQDPAAMAEPVAALLAAHGAAQPASTDGAPDVHDPA